jgi:PAS domain-containing protein
LQIAIRQRPTPTYDLGNVDTHVALVICDGTLPDTPIIYATEHFEKLTGYRVQEILGRNCRLLQEPPSYLGVTVPDSYREHNKEMKYHMRYRINHGQESQAKIVNYKKTGEPFMNVLTTIPITYPDPKAGSPETSRRYIVGFQAPVRFDI